MHDADDDYASANEYTEFLPTDHPCCMLRVSYATKPDGELLDAMFTVVLKASMMRNGDKRDIANVVVVRMHGGYTLTGNVGHESGEIGRVKTQAKAIALAKRFIEDTLNLPSFEGAPHQYKFTYYP